MITFSRECEKLLQELKKFSSDTYYHCIRVKKMTYAMLQYINKEEKRYDQNEIDFICKGALLHDIGKLFVRNYLLTKRTKLTDEEKQAIAQHTACGHEALQKGLSEEESKIILDICLYHHDRVGENAENEEQLPQYVQIVSICDSYDALSSERIYHRSHSREETLAMIENGECGTFTPYMIECLKKITETDVV